MAVSRDYHSGRMEPSLFSLVVLHGEVVSHHNQISVDFSMLHFLCHDISEGIETRRHFTILVLDNLKFLRVIEEAKEVH